jgi:hypothetical protein
MPTASQSGHITLGGELPIALRYGAKAQMGHKPGTHTIEQTKCLTPDENPDPVEI